MDGAVPFAVYMHGFQLARVRFEKAGEEWEDGFHALLETATWSGAIRERDRRHGCPELEGLYFVRNLLIHAGGDALAQAVVTHGTGLGSWILGPGVLGSPDVHEWRWRPRAELPRTESPAGTDEYDDYLAGNLIAATLSIVGDYLDGLAIHL